MYKKITIYTLLLLVMSSAFAQKHVIGLQKQLTERKAVTSANKIADHLDHPETALDFSWNTSLSDWDSSSRYNYSYYPNGLLAQSMSENYSGGNWQFSNRSSLSYNAQGLLETQLYETWNGSAWENYYLFTTTYDVQGSPDTDFSMIWNVSQWDTMYGSRYQNTYVFTNRLASQIEEDWDTGTHQYDYSYRQDYHWPNSVQGWDSTTGYTWSGSAWVPEERFFDVVWHDFQEEIAASGQGQYWNGTSWEDSDRFQCTYSGPYDNSVCISEDWSGNSWDSSYKDLTFFDSLDHETGYVGYNWAGTWEVNYGEEVDYAYDFQGHTTEIIYNSLDTSGLYLPNYRILYSTFFTGIGDPRLPIASVTAYPNPCTDRLNFAIKLKQNGPVQIALYDLQGRLRAQTITPAQVGKEISIPVAEILENGTYVYRVDTKEGQSVGKVVVQR